MTDNLLLRAAHIEEREALEALQRRASLVWEEYRQHLLANPDAIALPYEQIRNGNTQVAMLGERLVGFCVVLPGDDGVAELDGLFVEPDCWRRGIGQRLLGAAEEWARAGGARHLHVIANPRALEFYRACGFALMGEAPTRFGPALQMQKPLLVSP